MLPPTRKDTVLQQHKPGSGNQSSQRCPRHCPTPGVARVPSSWSASAERRQQSRAPTGSKDKVLEKTSTPSAAASAPSPVQQQRLQTGASPALRDSPFHAPGCESPRQRDSRWGFPSHHRGSLWREYNGVTTEHMGKAARGEQPL